jgi:hypothetical protein
MPDEAAADYIQNRQAAKPATATEPTTGATVIDSKMQCAQPCSLQLRPRKAYNKPQLPCRQLVTTSRLETLHHPQQTAAITCTYAPCIKTQNPDLSSCCPMLCIAGEGQQQPRMSHQPGSAKSMSSMGQLEPGSLTAVQKPHSRKDQVMLKV